MLRALSTSTRPHLDSDMRDLNRDLLPPPPTPTRDEIIEAIWLAMANSKDNACEAVYEALKILGVKLP